MRSSVLALLVAILMIASVNAQTTTCSVKGGACNDIRVSTCSTGFQQGLCSGGKTMQCCFGIVKVNEPEGPNVDTPTAPIVALPLAPIVIPAFNPLTLVPVSPLWTRFQSCYPQGPASVVKSRLGGDANRAYIKNTNAIRMSATFNCVAKASSSIKYLVPAVAGQYRNAVAASKENLAVHVADFYSQVANKVLGKPTLVLKSMTYRGVDASGFANKRGVIYFDTEGAWSNQAGRFDLWDGSNLVSTGATPNPAAVARNFALAKKVYFWAL